jgi:hypothetical protein
MPTSKLPAIAYFQAGAGPVSQVLAKACRAAGFFNLAGHADLDAATEVWIEPPGKPAEEISPPGGGPPQLYDTSSLITIVVAHSQLPVEAAFETPGEYEAAEIIAALTASGFRNVTGATGFEKVTEVWVSTPEYQVAPRAKQTEELFSTDSLIVLIGEKSAGYRGGRKRGGKGKPRKGGSKSKPRAKSKPKSKARAAKRSKPPARKSGRRK